VQGFRGQPSLSSAYAPTGPLVKKSLDLKTAGRRAAVQTEGIAVEGFATAQGRRQGPLVACSE